MTLDEIRVEIDAVDTQMKPLFLKRMECAKQVSRKQRQKTGGDVFRAGKESCPSFEKRGRRCGIKEVL